MPENAHPTLGAQAARQLANTTKTPPQWIGVTPRWLVSLLPWTPVEAGTYRVNKVKEGGEKGIGIECSPSDGEELPAAFVDYEEQPREYTLSTVTTTIEVQTRISDLYRSPMDQVREQLGVLIEMVKERQENELVNNANYGLLNSVAPSMRVGDARRRARRPTTSTSSSPRSGRSRPSSSRTRAPSPPSGASAPGAASRRPRSRSSARPSSPGAASRSSRRDKLEGRRRNKTNILLLRTGEKKRGVVGLFQPGIPGEVSPSLSVRLMGINQRGAASYLVSLYCSAAVLTDDALGVLENVDVGKLP